MIHPIGRKIKLYKGKKSYTINKKKIYLCLFDENGNYYLDNHIIYVLCHEMAHVLSNSIGHTSEFEDNFKKLLERAEKIELYNPNIPMPEDYCTYN